MLNNGIFDFTGFDPTAFGFDDSNATDDLFNFNAFGGGDGTGLNYQCVGPSDLHSSWYLQSPEVGAGVEVLGGLGDLSQHLNPLAAPTTAYPGYNPHFNPGLATTIPPQQPTNVPPPTVPATSLAPTLSHGFWPIPIPSTNGTPDIGTIRNIAPFDEGHRGTARVEISDPFGLFRLNEASYPEFTTPGAPLPTPTASSSGPQRRGRCGKSKRKYDPVKSTKAKNIDEGGYENGWDVTLEHFRARLHEIVFDGQPPGFLHEVALAAKITELTKEEVKRSPLQDTKAGQWKRPRHTEDFLIGILGEIVPTLSTGQGVSENIGKKGAFFTRLADELESRLVAINDSSALRKPWVNSREQAGKGIHLEQTERRATKNKLEKAKRGGERSQMERMSRLFRVANPQRTWTRVEVLSFAVLFLFWGPSAFSPGFVREAPALQRSQTENGPERT